MAVVKSHHTPDFGLRLSHEAVHLSAAAAGWAAGQILVIPSPQSPQFIDDVDYENG